MVDTLKADTGLCDEHNIQTNYWKWNGSFSNCLYCTLCANFTKWFETIRTAVCLEILAGLQQRAQQSLIYAAALSSNTCTLSFQPKRSANVHKNISHVKHFASLRLFITHRNHRTNSPMPFFRAVTWISKNLQGSLHQLTPLHKLSQHSTFC